MVISRTLCFAAAACCCCCLLVDEMMMLLMADGGTQTEQTDDSKSDKPFPTALLPSATKFKRKQHDIIY
jgi:hypothetical protein